MKLIPIKSMKFGAAIQVSGTQEVSMTLNDDVRNNAVIVFDTEKDLYLIERNGSVTMVHATNVQYAIPKDIKSVSDYVSHSTVPENKTQKKNQ